MVVPMNSSVHEDETPSGEPSRLVNAGYYFLAIVAVVLIGFVPSYFPAVSGRNVEMTRFVHFHATLMGAWLTVLVVQPFLIKHGRPEWHRRVGQATYFLLPLVLAALVLMIHDRLNRASEVPEGILFYIGAKDVLLIGLMYGLAIRFRKSSGLHARFMIASTFQVLEPGLVRTLGLLIPQPGNVMMSWLLIDAILGYLAFRDRKSGRVKWVFRFALAMTIAVQLFPFLVMPYLPFYDDLVSWFESLGLT